MAHVYQYDVLTRKTAEAKPKLLRAQPHVTSKRGAIRAARRDVRDAWAELTPHQYEVRANVYLVPAKGAKVLIRQVYINADTARNGWRKMLRDEEV